MDATISDPLVGRMLDGRYRIESRLARGGMATVYRALDLRLDRTVAIKVMHSSLVEDEEFVSRFHREARAAARLSHPNAVAVFDQGSDDEHVFLAMEYVEGRTLRDMLADRGRLTPREAFRILEPVLAALGAAHHAGLVHRDVKPENVLLAEDGRVKVADFGLARAVSSVSSVTRSTGVLIGTVAYLSPEQVERGIADARSDVYSAGILLFEMLTGEPPHEGDTPLAVAYQHVHADVPAPSSRVEGLPVAVDALVARAANRDPDLRPVDARAFHQLAVHARTNLPDDELDVGGPDATVIGSAARHTLIVPVGGHQATDGRHVREPFDGPGRSAGTGAALDGAPGVQGRDAAVDQDGAEGRADLVGGPDELEPETARPGWRDRLARGRGRLALLLVLLLAVLVGVGAWWLGSGRYIDTPKVVGLQKAAAVDRLRDAGLDVFMADEAFSETVPVGHVVSTAPAAGDRVTRTGEVRVVVSKGKERYDVPTLAGAPLDKAESTLQGTNLDVGGVVSRYSLKVDKDHVIRSFPGPGTQVRRDTDIRLLVSRGPRPVELPDLAGQDENTAAATLDEAGLDVTTSTAHSDDVAAGLVMGQEPAAGEVVPRGSTVHLVVSKGPPIVTVPDVTGANVDVATQTLEQTGFVVDVQEFPGGPRNVLRQSPTGGENHPRGTTVTLYVF